MFKASMWAHSVFLAKDYYLVLVFISFYDFLVFIFTVQSYA